MPLTGEEIKANLTRFAARWSVRDGCERGEAQTFLTELFDCYRQRLSDVAEFERFQAGGFVDLICTARGWHVGYKSLKERYRAALKAAGLREDFRFHNLRHTFGSTVIRYADSREVMEWMGHADLTTTRRYLAFVDREDAAKRVSEAFRLEEPQESSSSASVA